jgi:hypothetical protein
VLVNYASYTQITGHSQTQAAEARRWQASLSPLLGHLRLLARRITAYRSTPEPGATLAGFSFAEGAPGEPFPRWTTGEARVDTRACAEPVRIAASIARWPEARHGLPVDLAAPGGSLEVGPGDEPGSLEVAASFPAPAGCTVRRLLIRSDVFRPEEDAERRELGVSVRALSVERGTATRTGGLTVGEARVPPLPVSRRHPWGKDAMAWFYAVPTHLVDTWWWYLWHSGLPRWPVWLVALPALTLLLSGWRLLPPVPPPAARLSVPPAGRPSPPRVPRCGRALRRGARWRARARSRARPDADRR